MSVCNVCGGSQKVWKELDSGEVERVVCDRCGGTGIDPEVRPEPLTLDLKPLQEVPKSKRNEHKLTIQEHFEAFHTANPWVYNALVKLARDLVDHGRSKFGAKMLVEILRWNYWRETFDEHSDFKISNDLTSRYARRIMDQEPDLRGCFQIKELRTK